jgi:hypothetical protein
MKRFAVTTFQGSILGPILCAIFVSPVFDVEFMLAFADDNYLPKVNCAIPSLIKDMEKPHEAITKWLRNSGLVVNQNKTELCLFYKRNVPSISIGRCPNEIKM